jgi:hypothetical protein
MGRFKESDSEINRNCQMIKYLEARRVQPEMRTCYQGNGSDAAMIPI